MTDFEQKLEGNKVGFGLGQINNPTPMFAKYIMRGVAFASGVWALLPQDLIGLTDAQYGQANRWLLVGNAVLLFAIKFFGWKPSEE